MAIVPGEARAERLRSVRDALEMTQSSFLPVLNREAERQRVRGYTQSTLSKLESGAQAASFEDVAVFAAVDPRRRGKLWLGWGETNDATLGMPGVRDIPVDSMERVSTAKKAPAKKRATGR